LGAILSVPGTMPMMPIHGTLLGRRCVWTTLIIDAERHGARQYRHIQAQDQQQADAAGAYGGRTVFTCNSMIHHTFLSLSEGGRKEPR